MSATPEPRIPLNDLLRNTQQIRAELDAALARVLESGWFVLGPENAALETELSAYLGVTDTVLVGNGTDALQLALSAVGVSAGDRVMTVANAGGYSSTAVRTLGAQAVYVDVEPTDHLMSLRSFDEALDATATTPKAVVVTHLYGAAADVEPIVERAGSRGIAVVEDCAQALGARRGERMAGSFGDIATISFYPTKNLGAVGDAGAVATSNPELAASVRRLRQYGWESKYRTTVPGGINSRMDELQAAIVRAKLPHLDAWNERRREIHARYERVSPPGLRFVTSAVDGFIGHLAVVEVEDRERARGIFDDAGIATDVHYPIPDHLQPLLGGGSDPSLSVTEHAAEHILSIPLFPELREDEIARVCDALGRV